MDNKKPEFALPDLSVIHLVTELHAYFRDLQSYYQIAQGSLINQLKSAADETKAQDLQEQLHVINKKVEYFHVLNNAISIADVVIHTETLIPEFHSPENES